MAMKSPDGSSRDRHQSNYPDFFKFLDKRQPKSSVETLLEQPDKDLNSGP